MPLWWYAILVFLLVREDSVSSAKRYFQVAVPENVSLRTRELWNVKVIHVFGVGF
jgi:hypothetical protein